MTAITLHLIPNRIGTNGVGRNLPVPMFAHIASPVEMACQDWTVEHTETGIVCGQCSDGTSYLTLDENGREFDTPRTQVRHATIEHVRECYSEAARQAAETAAELWAEGAYDRWAEGGWDKTGAYSYDPYERAAF